MLLVLVAVLAAYCVVGAVYNAAFNGIRGVEMVPHSAFWLDTIDFCRELFANITARLRGHGGYQQI